MTVNERLRREAWENHLRRWAQAIAEDMRSGKCPHDIVGHIQKHAIEDLNRHAADGMDKLGCTRWAASMRNLVMIFEEYYDVHPTVEDQLERLEDQYRRKPDIRTPSPEKRE